MIAHVRVHARLEQQQHARLRSVARGCVKRRIASMVGMMHLLLALEHVDQEGDAVLAIHRARDKERCPLVVVLGSHVRAGVQKR